MIIIPVFNGDTEILTRISRNRFLSMIDSGRARWLVWAGEPKCLRIISRHGNYVWLGATSGLQVVKYIDTIYNMARTSPITLHISREDPDDRAAHYRRHGHQRPPGQA